MCFSPLPFGEVGGTKVGPDGGIWQSWFQSPTVRGSGWNPAPSGTRRPCRLVSVLYRSGKWVEPPALRGMRAGHARFSPLPFGEVGGTQPIPSAQMPVQVVSVPYRSGKWVELDMNALGKDFSTLFQSPTVRGSGWNSAITARLLAESACRFSPLPFGEVGGTERTYVRLQLPVGFQSPTVRGSGWNCPHLNV